jgi:hypothetical protein
MSQKDINTSGEWARNVWTVLVNEPERSDLQQVWYGDMQGVDTSLAIQLYNKLEYRTLYQGTKEW